MKKSLLVSFCVLVIGLKAQCLLNLGPNVSVCNAVGLGTANIGNNLVITNGVAPFTYVWEAKYEIHISI